MKNILIILGVFVFSFFSFLPATQSQPPKSSWNYHESKDKMTGKIDQRYIVSYSKNELKGWLNKGKILLGYTCGSGFYVRANDIGFHTDNIDCTSYGCSSIQYARIKFDEGTPFNVDFTVWEKNNDGMSLNPHYQTAIIYNMKKGSIMFLELELFSTKGEQQIAEFNLNGFTKAFNRCGSNG